MQILERIQLTERQVRLLKWIGYPLFGVFVFAVSMYASIPRDRIRERLERELSQDSGPTAPIGTGMDVTIGDLGLSLLSPGVSLSEITLKQRILTPLPGDEGKKPQTYTVESLDVRTSLLKMLLGSRVVKLDVHAFGGELSAEGQLSAQDVAAEVRASDIQLGKLPSLSQKVTIPIGGTLDLSVDFSAKMDEKSKRMNMTTASGQIDLSVEGCSVGDGKAKLAVPGDPFLSQGITFPKVQLGKVSGKVIIQRGRATLDKLRTKSVDAEASLEGYIELREPLPQSELHLYLRFKPSEALIKKESTIELLANGMAMGKRSDGFLGFAITGSIAFPNSRPSKEPPSGVSERTSTSHGAGPSFGSLPGGGVGTQRGFPTRPSSPAVLPSVNTPPPPPPKAELPPPSPAPSQEPPQPSPSSAGGPMGGGSMVPPPPPGPSMPAPEEPARPAQPGEAVDPNANLPPSYPSNQRGTEDR